MLSLYSWLSAAPWVRNPQRDTRARGDAILLSFGLSMHHGGEKKAKHHFKRKMHQDNMEKWRCHNDYNKIYLRMTYAV
jgi:hypothetical protein